MRKILSLFLFVSCILFIPPSVFAVRYAQCDPCGLCKDTTKSKLTPAPIYVQPQSWANCFNCLYPTAAVSVKVDCDKDEATKDLTFIQYVNGVEITISPSDPNKRCDTLLIDPQKNEPTLSPQSGRQFSDIGCISVDTANGRFSDPNASVDVVQRLLSIVLSVTGGVGTIYILISAGALLTSKGDPERIREGKQKLVNTLIGVAFTLFALFVFRFIAGNVLRIPGLG